MGLKIDGIMANESIDSSGEILDVHGNDITDLLEGKGQLNWEHEKGPEDIIGAIIYAKKIYSADDCETDRQRMFHKLSKGPYIYIIGELYDDTEHAGACAVAAMIRWYHVRKEKMFIGFSIEGQTLHRKGNLLEQSVARKCAVTARPCNKNAIMDVFDDPKIKDTVKKFEQPSLIRSFEVDSVIVDDPLLDVKMSVEQLAKTLTAGQYNVAPSTLSAGSAISVEDRGLKNRVKAVVRDWDRKRPLREVIKAALPELSDSYVDHFTDLAEDLQLKKGIKPPVRIGTHNSANQAQSEAQRKLIDGLYIDEQKPFRSRDTHGIGQSKLYRIKNDAGQSVMVKTPQIVGDQGHEAAHNATAYQNIAHQLFGLGDHVPVTNHFEHPRHPGDDMHGHSWSAQEFIQQAKPAHGKLYHDAAMKGREQGWLHRLAAMDMILGVPDRHMGNVLVRDGRLIHIDNDYAFEHRGVTPHSFADEDVGNVQQDTMDPKTMEWLQSIDPRQLAQQLRANGIVGGRARASLFALRAMQQHGAKMPLGKLNDMIAQQVHALHDPLAAPLGIK